MSKDVKNEQQTFNSQKGSEKNISPFCFYQALQYPLPSNREIFSYMQNTKPSQIQEKKEH